MKEMNKAEIDAKVREVMPFSHRWHNRFHLDAPFGLINDPNGLSYYNGEYHIFFQWNPMECTHFQKGWGHVRTRDFVNYTMPELSLWPSDAHDKNGCYSGCAFVEEGTLRVLYTCNAMEDGRRIPAQRLGTFKKDGTVQKDKILIPKEAEGFTGHFRDPYLFVRRGKKYMLIGTQTEEKRGCVVCYCEEADGWKFLGELKTKKAEAEEDFGYMWECPALLKFDSYDVLMFCPQGLSAHAYKYQNLHQSGYFAGHASFDSMEMYHGRFQEFDHGFDFYAPQVFCHEGRHILIGWMGMPDKDMDYPTKEKGWMYTLTMPRLLTLRQGHIYQNPLRELKELRILETAIEVEEEDTKSVHTSLGDGAEAILDIALGDAQMVTYEILYGMEKLVFVYDRNQQTMKLSREGMELGGRGERIFKLFTEDSLSLQLFVDRTAVEVFFQHGEEAASILAFPKKHIVPELCVTSDASMKSVSGKVWELDGLRYH